MFMKAPSCGPKFIDLSVAKAVILLVKLLTTEHHIQGSKQQHIFIAKIFFLSATPSWEKTTF